MQDGFGEFTVCVVEMCTGCGWNNMIIDLPPGEWSQVQAASSADDRGGH